MQRNYLKQFIASVFVLFVWGNALELGYGAIDANTVWEVRPTVGNDTNGGGSVSGAAGTDYSTNNNKNASACSNCGSSTVNLSVTDLVTAGTATIVSATANFSAAIVGNIVLISGGTGSITADWYQAVTFTNSTTIVVDRATGLTAGTGATINIGGALNSFTQLNTNMSPVQGNAAWVKATGTVSLASPFTFNFNGSAAGQYVFIQGYTSTRGDNGMVTISPSVNFSTSFMLTNSTFGITFANFIMDCNGNTARGYNFNLFGQRVLNVTIQNCTGDLAFLFSAAGNQCVQCTVINQAGSDATLGAYYFLATSEVCIWCVAVGGTGPGAGFFWATTQGPGVFFSIAANNAGDGFSLLANQSTGSCIGCDAYGNAGDGFKFRGTSSAGNFLLMDSIAYGNTGFGLNLSTGAPGYTGTRQFDYNGYGNNTAGNLNNLTAGSHDVTLSANPFTNGAGNNFALNSTAGGGAALKGVGFPGALNTGGTGHLDIGALQSAGGGGGSSGPVGIGFVQ